MGKKKVIAGLTIQSSLAGKKVIEVLREELAIPQRQIKKAIFTKGLFVNRRPVHSESRVKIGDRLLIKLPVDEQIKVKPVPMELRIIFEDQWFLAVNKQTGINVHNTRPGEPPALVNGVAAYFLKQNKMLTPRPLHRIDRHASGVVLFAKSAEAQREVAKVWRAEQTKKIYWALVEGVLTEGGEIITPLGGKKAETSFTPLKNYQKFTAVRIELKTGRTHQIRKHFYLTGHPVLGDPIYNKQSGLSVQRLALHSFVLKLVHPKTGERLCLEAPIPWEEFSDLPGVTKDDF